MIKNYLYAVGKYLPASQRDDTLKDLEANIYDSLRKLTVTGNTRTDPQAMGFFKDTRHWSRGIKGHGNRRLIGS
jgi:hypothetical protein